MSILDELKDKEIVKAYIITKEKRTYYRETYKKEDGELTLVEKVKVGTISKIKERYTRYPRYITEIGLFGYSVIQIIQTVI